MVTGYVPGPCASVGVQLKAPVPAPIVAPVAAGVPSVNDHAIVFAGRSESVAFTVNVIASTSLAVVGVPLSVTRTVIGNDPGPCASVGVQLNAPDAPPIVAP